MRALEAFLYALEAGHSIASSDGIRCRLCGYEKAQTPFTHPPVSPCKVQQNNLLDFGWINRCVKRFPYYREPHTIEHCGHWANMGPMVNCGMDYMGFTGLPKAMNIPHGQRLPFFPSPSHAMSLLLCDSGKIWPLTMVSSFMIEIERENWNSLFFWVTNYAECSITRGLSCWASQLGRKSGLIKAVSNTGALISHDQGRGLSWQLLPR